MSHADRVAAYYDANTEAFYLRWWDEADLHFGLFEHDDLPLPEALKAMTRAVTAPARIARGEQVLDAGCGVGGAAIDLARISGCAVLGVTVSPRQVELAQHRARDAGIAGVRFILGDCARHLPVADGSMDVVVSLEAACHFADKPAFLRECARVLRPGGRLAMSDWLKVPERIRTHADEAMIGSVEHAWRLAQLYSMDEWHSALKGGGFEVLESQDFNAAVRRNAWYLIDARQELLLEAANRSGARADAELWLRQLESLYGAWQAGVFSVGRFLAIRSN